MTATATPRQQTELRPDLLVELGRRGCLACNARDEALERYVTWFAIESHAEPATLAGLRGSLGFCPPHARRLLAVPRADAALRTPYSAIVRAARALLDDPATAAQCPACAVVDGAELRSLQRLVDELGDRDVAAAYGAGDGLCLPHLEATLRFAPFATARTLAAPLADAEELRFGSDPDANARAACRARVPQPTRQSATTIERLIERLEHDACPTCLAAGRAERRYLTWLTHEAAHRTDALAVSLEGLCPSHLHDIADAGLRGWVVAVQTRARQAEIQKMLRAPAPSAPRRWPRRASVDEWREALLRPRVCPACRAANTVERRESELLAVTLGDHRVAHRYVRSHGLCVWHALGTTASIVRDVAAVRLETIGWELEESLRKTGWDFRHEPQGPEADAWRRAPALLDGATYLGAPAGEMA
jgi:hypothetical protein